MRTRARPGTYQTNQLGLPAKCFRKKSNRCLRMLQPLLFDHELEFRAGTLVGFAKGTARIPGTGKRLRNWLELSRDAFV